MAAPAQLPLPFAPMRRRAEGVIAAGSNAEARAWLAHEAAWPQGRLALWGPAGSGKSALLAEWAAREGGRVIAGAALRFPPPQGPLAIDDADLADPRALLHVLNAAQEAGQPVLLAARAPPSRWPPAIPDLASRLRATTAVAIGPPEDDLLRALLARQLAERQLRVAMPTLDWLVARLPRTHAAAAEAVARLDRAAQALAAPIAPALARLVLPDLLADLPDSDLPPSGMAHPDDDVLAAHPAPASPGQDGFL
jgi:chromosomal replication initiation ATPase DnaA